MRKTFALLLLVASASAAQAQDARLTRRLDPVTARNVQSLADSAAADGLPGEPLIKKALEGASKGASSGEIDRALRSLLGGMRSARMVLGADADVREIMATTTAIQAGVSIRYLETLRRHRDSPAFVNAVIGSAFLRQRGVSDEAAVEIARNMLEARLKPDDFAVLQRLVDQDMRAGAAANTAARVRAQALIQHGASLRPRELP
jgi:hypothetical protein